MKTKGTEEIDKWSVHIEKCGGIVISSNMYGSYGGDPLDLSKEDREKMIQALKGEKQ